MMFHALRICGYDIAILAIIEGHDEPSKQHHYIAEKLKKLG
jgi:hypothetical protein